VGLARASGGVRYVRAQPDGLRGMRASGRSGPVLSSAAVQRPPLQTLDCMVLMCGPLRTWARVEPRVFGVWPQARGCSGGREELFCRRQAGIAAACLRAWVEGV
jgi:hypothetical protein